MEGFERRTLEINRVSNLVQTSGWEEKSRKVDRETLFVTFQKDLSALVPAERRMEISKMHSLVTVFGWESSESSFDNERATETLTKTLKIEVGQSIE